MHSHSDEGRKWLEAALARDEGAPLAVRIRVLEALYWLAFDRWDHERAEAIASEAMELSAEAEIQSSLAASLRVMSAGPAWGLGDTERGKEIYEEGADLCREAGYTFRLPDFLFSLGYQLLLEGDYERGRH